MTNDLLETENLLDTIKGAFEHRGYSVSFEEGSGGVTFRAQAYAGTEHLNCLEAAWYDAFLLCSHQLAEKAMSHFGDSVTHLLLWPGEVWQWLDTRIVGPVRFTVEFSPKPKLLASVTVSAGQDMAEGDMGANV